MPRLGVAAQVKGTGNNLVDNPPLLFQQPRREIIEGEVVVRREPRREAARLDLAAAVQDHLAYPHCMGLVIGPDPSNRFNELCMPRVSPGAGVTEVAGQ